jgi:hypothetical protein
MRLFIDEFFFTVNTLFPPLRECLYAACQKLFAEMLELFTHAVFQLVVVSKKVSSASWWPILPVANKVEGGACQIRTVGRMKDSSPRRCCNCVPCVQTGVRSGVVVQEEDLIHLPV